MARAHRSKDLDPETDQEQNPEADKIDAADPYKQFKNRKVQMDEFWPMVKAITEKNQWGRYKTYVYSYWPVIIRQLSDPSNKNNLAVIDEPFDVEYLLHTFGSGTYGLHLCDQTRPQKFQCVCRTEIKLKDNDHPPVRDLREIDLGHKDNRSYVDGLRARGLLKGEDVVDGKTSDNAALIGLFREFLIREKDKRPAESVEGQAVSKALDMLSSTYKTSLDTLVKSDSGNNGLAIVKEVVSAMKEMRPPVTNGESSGKDVLVATLVTMLTESQKQQTILLTKMLEKGTAPDSTEKTIDLLSKMRGFLGAGTGEGSGPGDSKWSFWTAMVQGLPSMLGEVKEMVIGSMAYRGAQAARVPLTPRTTAAASPAGPQAPALPAPAEEPNPEPVPVQLTPEVQQVLSLIGPKLEKCLAEEALYPGLELADWIESGYGDKLPLMIAQRGPEELNAAIRAFPPLWNSIHMYEAKLGPLIDEFCTWPVNRVAFQAGELPGMQDDGGEGEPEPPIPETRKRKGAK
jgi:hypothetical protein